MTALNWLHFTDWHIGSDDKGLWPNVKRELLADLRRLGMHQQRVGHGPWDVVLFTGDLAFSGRASEYARIDRELEELWAVLREPWPGSNAPVLLAVPGNHDLLRTDTAIVTALGLRGSADQRERLFAGKSEALASVAGGFSDYRAWWERCPYRPKSGLKEGLLPGDFTFTLEKEGRRFGFVGLNTSFLDVDRESRGQLRVDLRQLRACCDDSLARFCDEREHSFLLTHHPPDWLAPESQQHYEGEIAPPRQFAAHLCGHLHESRFEERRSGFGGERRLWQGASLFGLETLADETRERIHGYAAGRLELDAQGGEAMLWPRLAVKVQGGAWRLTSDYTFELQDDIARTPAVPVRHRRHAALAPVVPALPLPAPVSAPVTWREALEGAPLWRLMAGAPETGDPWRKLAGEIADVCQEVWREAEAALPGDAWRDERYPVRVLWRLARFLETPKVTLTPAETLLLGVAPFVHEAVRACGTCWMVEADPENLDYTSASKEPRNTLEQIHLARPDLKRRVERLEGSERRGVVLWMMHRALERTSALWEQPPRVARVQRLAQRLTRLSGDADASWLTWERLASFARCVGASLDFLDGERGFAKGRLDETPAEGVRIRSAALAYLLCAAGWNAFELTTADEAAVEHIGLGDGFHLGDLRAALHEAQWQTSETADVLFLECRHPVVDFVLGRLVTQADELIERIRQRRQSAAESLVLLDGLPARLSAELRAAKGGDGRPLYRLPHIRFRLEHHRVRELLMGPELYGDPTLALRELYQNALDACRYRRARQRYLERQGKWYGAEYEGRILFHQGSTPSGRTYIECTDNGVGMTDYELERIFSIAGKRFVDAPDFQEEQAAWRRSVPPIELHPNSQFGVGVMSYFMLADEIEVTTRRFQREGSLGTLLVVKISSANGLFRLMEEKDEHLLSEGGTRVRLFLGETEYKDESGGKTEISVRKSLDSLLWVAEFQTEVHDGRGKPRVWNPGVLALSESDVATDYLPTSNSDVWWSLSGGPILADGLVVGDNGEHPLLVVNLRGAHYPHLSVDRTNIIEWKKEWLSEVLEQNWKRLLDWPELTVEFIWTLEGNYLKIARKLFRALVERRAEINLAVNWPEPVKIHELGSTLLDAGITNETAFSREPNGILGLWREAMLHRSGLHVLRGGGAASSGRNQKKLARIDELQKIVAEPGDSEIFGWDRIEDYHGELDIEDVRLQWHLGEFVLDVLDLFWLSRRQERPVSELLERLHVYRPMGAHVRWSSPWQTIAEMHLSKEDLVLLSSARDGSPPWRRSFSAVDIFGAVQTIGCPMSAVIERLKALAPKLGLKFSQELTALTAVVVTPEDWRILAACEVANDPTRLISALDVLLAAKALSRPPEAIVQRLADLSTPLALQFAFNPATFRFPVLDADAWRLLSRNLNGEAPWLNREVSAIHVLHAARKLKTSAFDMGNRMNVLAASVGLQARFDTEALAKVRLTREDWILLSVDFDGSPPWLNREVFLGPVLRIALKTNMEAVDVARRLGELAPFLGLTMMFDPAFLERLRDLNYGDVFICSESRNGRAPWRHVPFEVPEVIQAAAQRRGSITKFVERVHQLGLLSIESLTIVLEALKSVGKKYQRDSALLLLCFINAHGDMEETFARARTRVWWLSDSELEAHFAALKPLLDLSLGPVRQ